MTTISKLPTAATSYYDFRQVMPEFWCVDLVTPLGVRARKLRTCIISGPDRAAVLDHAQQAAAKAKRPLKIGRAA